MKKDILTFDAIKMDFLKILAFRLKNKIIWRFTFFFPFALIAVLLGIKFNDIFVFLAASPPALYNVVRFIIDYVKHRKNKKTVLSFFERGEISISTEVFSHIAVETVYEPHGSGHRGGSTKSVRVYYFRGGASWRIQEAYMHYSWSKNYCLSTKGLENLSIAGDEFFYIKLQNHPDIAYIYPCKIFELDACINNNSTFL